MIKEEKAKINAQLMTLAGRVKDLLTDENQSEVYRIVEEMEDLYDKIFNM